MRDTIKNPYEKITLFEIPWLQCYFFLVLELVKPTTFRASTLVSWKQQQHYVYFQETCIHYSMHNNGPIIQLNDSIQLWVIETLLSILLGKLFRNICKWFANCNWVEWLFKHYPPINWLFTRSNLNKITWNSI